MGAKSTAIVFIFGEGGHAAEMKKLIGYLKAERSFDNDNIIWLTDNKRCSEVFDRDNAIEIIVPPSHKTSRIKSIFYLLVNFVMSVVFWVKVSLTYDVKVVISTGPGIALFPSILFKLSGAYLIFVESICLFNSRSKTGSVLYHWSDRFFVQNKSLLDVYPKAVFCGQLL